VKKWEPTGLLEGLDETEIHSMSILLENQARQLIDETSKTSTSTNSEEWSGVALPLVRRIFSEIAAKDFVSVQPMNLPSGLIFYLDFKYATAQPGFTVATGSLNQVGTVHGVTTGSEASDGLYGAGRFAYSINDQAATGLALVASGAADWGDVDFDPDLSASIAAGTPISRITIATSGLTRPDLEGVRAFKISHAADAPLAPAWYPAYTVITGSSVLSLYGLRDCKDLDLIYYNNAPVDSHNQYLETHYKLTLDNIVNNPLYYLYHNGFKYVSLDVIKNMKVIRNEPKDIIDVQLIEKMRA
ncbi:hypothetical protein LCGC14_2376500, partial [marine sediment metagenome]